jgi:hypothetical protein
LNARQRLFVTFLCGIYGTGCVIDFFIESSTDGEVLLFLLSILFLFLVLLIYQKLMRSAFTAIGLGHVKHPILISAMAIAVILITVKSSLTNQQHSSINTQSLSPKGTPADIQMNDGSNLSDSKEGSVPQFTPKEVESASEVKGVPEGATVELINKEDGPRSSNATDRSENGNALQNQGTVRNEMQPAQPVAPAQAPTISERISVPANAVLDYTGHDWTCISGYRRQGNECIQVGISANAVLDYTGHDWTCISGYRRQGNECVQVGIPENADLDYTGHSWACNRGYRQQGQGCVPVVIPANADLDYTGHSWTCNHGYRQEGYECVPVVIPANANLDYTGHSWICNRGYRQQGYECVPVVIPANADLDYTGHSWTCNRGYRQQGQGCVSVGVSAQ